MTTAETRIVDHLSDLQIPEMFSSRAKAGEFFDGEKTIAELEKEKISRISDVLIHPELESLINEGKITLGIIKPKANEGRDLSPDDDQAAQSILGEIGEENVIFSLSLKLTRQQAEAFYRPNKRIQEVMTDSADPSITVWESVSRFTSSAPLTFVLIYRPQGDAVEWWREKMGSTNPQRARDENPDSIRARHAQGLPNNAVHGSDSIDSVRTEVRALANILKTI